MSISYLCIFSTTYLNTSGYDVSHLTADQLSDSYILDDYPSISYIAIAQTGSSSGDPYVTNLNFLTQLKHTLWYNSLIIKIKT